VVNSALGPAEGRISKARPSPVGLEVFGDPYVYFEDWTATTIGAYGHRRSAVGAVGLSRTTVGTNCDAQCHPQAMKS